MCVHICNYDIIICLTPAEFHNIDEKEIQNPAVYFAMQIR